MCKRAAFFFQLFRIVEIRQQRRQKLVDRRFVPDEQGDEFFIFR